MLGVCQGGEGDAFVQSSPCLGLTSRVWASCPHPSFMPSLLPKEGLQVDSNFYKMTHTITIRPLSEEKE